MVITERTRLDLRTVILVASIAAAGVTVHYRVGVLERDRERDQTATEKRLTKIEDDREKAKQAEHAFELKQQSLETTQVGLDKTQQRIEGTLARLESVVAQLQRVRR